VSKCTTNVLDTMTLGLTFVSVYQCRESTDMTAVACKLSVPSAPEESEDFKEASSMLEQLTGARAAVSDAMAKVDEAQVEMTEKKEKMQEYQDAHDVEALQAKLKGLREQERGGSKKVKTSGARESLIVDLTAASSDDEDQGGTRNVVVAQARLVGEGEVEGERVVATAVPVGKGGGGKGVVAVGVLYSGLAGDAEEEGGGAKKKTKR